MDLHVLDRPGSARSSASKTAPADDADLRLPRLPSAVSKPTSGPASRPASATTVTSAAVTSSGPLDQPIPTKPAVEAAAAGDRVEQANARPNQPDPGRSRHRNADTAGVRVGGAHHRRRAVDAIHPDLLTDAVSLELRRYWPLELLSKSLRLGVTNLPPE
ncbi:hypothetical protein HK405_005030, partial [Cladochytrium tenue]